MAAKKPGQPRNAYYARIGRLGGLATKKRHGGRQAAAPARKPKK